MFRFSGPVFSVAWRIPLGLLLKFFLNPLLVTRGGRRLLHPVYRWMGETTRGGYRLRYEYFGGTLLDVAIAADKVWVTDYQQDFVLAFDPAELDSGATWIETGRSAQVVRTGRSPDGLTVDGNFVWVVNRDDESVAKVDARSGEVIATVAVGKKPQKVTAGGGAIWVTNMGDGTVTRIDPATATPTATLPVGKAPVGIAVSGGRIYVTEPTEGVVWCVDQDGGAQAAHRIATGGFPFLAIADENMVWVTVQREQVVVAIDPRTAELVARIPVGRNPYGGCLDDGVLWVACQDDTLWQIDTATRSTIREPLRLAIKSIPQPIDIAVDNGILWVISAGGGLHRVQKLSGEKR